MSERLYEEDLFLTMQTCKEISSNFDSRHRNNGYNWCFDENDKGKISESLMKIQDSFYYQDFSYVVRVGAAISDWRGSVKKAVHPHGFAVFGEVSLSTKSLQRE